MSANCFVVWLKFTVLVIPVIVCGVNESKCGCAQDADQDPNRTNANALAALAIKSAVEQVVKDLKPESKQVMSLIFAAINRTDDTTKKAIVSILYMAPSESAAMPVITSTSSKDGTLFVTLIKIPVTGIKQHTAVVTYINANENEVNEVCRRFESNANEWIEVCGINERDLKKGNK